jgi:rRNA-processing protein FCF1
MASRLLRALGGSLIGSGVVGPSVLSEAQRRRNQETPDEVAAQHAQRAAEAYDPNNAQWAAWELERRRRAARTPREQQLFAEDAARAKTDTAFQNRLAEIAREGRFASGPWDDAASSAILPSLALGFTPAAPLVGAGWTGLGLANIAEGIGRSLEGLPGSTGQMGLGAMDVALPGIFSLFRRLRGVKPPRPVSQYENPAAPGGFRGDPNQYPRPAGPHRPAWEGVEDALGANQRVPTDPFGNVGRGRGERVAGGRSGPWTPPPPRPAWHGPSEPPPPKRWHGPIEPPPPKRWQGPMPETPPKRWQGPMPETPPKRWHGPIEQPPPKRWQGPSEPPYASPAKPGGFRGDPKQYKRPIGPDPVPTYRMGDEDWFITRNITPEMQRTAAQADPRIRFQTQAERAAGRRKRETQTGTRQYRVAQAVRQQKASGEHIFTNDKAIRKLLREGHLSGTFAQIRRKLSGARLNSLMRQHFNTPLDGFNEAPV